MKQAMIAATVKGLSAKGIKSVIRIAVNVNVRKKYRMNAEIVVVRTDVMKRAMIATTVKGLSAKGIRSVIRIMGNVNVRKRVRTNVESIVAPENAIMPVMIVKIHAKELNVLKGRNVRP